jgi:hypothetical protein
MTTDPAILLICTECDWHGQFCDVEMVQDPKPGFEWHQWQVCPLCREADHLVHACDEPGCIGRASCGWPDETGRYRHTCSTHYARPIK